MTKNLHYTVENGIACITIDNPPVNACSQSVRIGLVDAFERVSASDDVRAVILVGEGANFMAGSDIKEFGKALSDPDLPTVIAAIERCPKPVVAAIRGSALGGGLELTLACDMRIGATDAIMGLPEVTLGMIPGAGGTQRLPRLTGISRAMELVALGKRITAQEALCLGIIDQIVKPENLISAAAIAVDGAPKRVLAELDLPASNIDEQKQTEQKLLAGAKDRRAVIEAIASVKRAAELPFGEALAIERAVFQRLRMSEEAFALRYNFFSERKAGKLDSAERADPLPLNRVGVIGAGTMGAGIAAVLLASGYETILIDSSDEALKRGREKVQSALDDLVRIRRLEAGDAAKANERLRTATDFVELGEADLVVEAVFEDLQVKMDLFERLGATLGPDVLLASNTSYLDLETIARASGRPHNFFGLHFFAPVHRMRLVEVVKASATIPAALATALKLARTIGKLPVIAGPSEGFIGNRIYAKYRAQCEFMLEDGSLPEEIDSAVCDLGFAMGIFAVSDLSGLDIAWAMRKRQAATRDPRERYVPIADKLCEMNRLGRKTGKGWYDYAEGGSGRPNPFVTEIVRKAARLRNGGNDIKGLSAEEIRKRVLGTILNEAALVLEDGIARSASDIDLVVVNGYGFSKYRGGPLFLASRMSDSDIGDMIDFVERDTGFGFRRGDVAALIEEIRNF